MAEFDDKLNSLLSNPEAMDQIMKMAQSLMGTSGENPETGGSPRNAAGASGSAAPPPRANRRRGLSHKSSASRARVRMPGFTR